MGSIRPKNSTEITKELAKDIRRYAGSHGMQPDNVFLDALRIGLLELHAFTGKPLPADMADLSCQGIMARYQGTRDQGRMVRDLAARLVGTTMWFAPFDLAGHVYEALDMSGSQHIGQFFTPWDISLLSAEMLEMQNAAANGGTTTEEMVHQNLKAALTHPANLVGQAALIAGLALPKEEVRDYFFWHLVPLALPYYEPVTVPDPALGSGRLLIAHAAITPFWLHFWGLVQYYGADIDARAVLVARFNMAANMLNGWGALLLHAAMQKRQQAQEQGAHQMIFDLDALNAVAPAPPSSPKETAPNPLEDSSVPDYWGDLPLFQSLDEANAALERRRSKEHAP